MSWYHSLAQWIEKRGGKREIKLAPKGKGSEERKLYLERFYIVKTKFMEIMIHRFHLSDEPELHDHPWASWSIILQTGYNEVVLEDGKEVTYFRAPGYFGSRSATDFHRVALKPGTEGDVWTLFITFRRERKWGFLTDKGWVAFDERLKERNTLKDNENYADYVGWLFPVKEEKKATK